MQIGINPGVYHSYNPPTHNQHSTTWESRIHSYRRATLALAPATPQHARRALAPATPQHARRQLPSDAATLAPATLPRPNAQRDKPLERRHLASSVASPPQRPSSRLLARSSTPPTREDTTPGPPFPHIPRSINTLRPNREFVCIVSLLIFVFQDDN